MHEPVPFKTTDAILAASLYAAGIPEYLPPTNTFTPDILRRLGYAGEALIASARKAWKRGDRGRVEYHFEKTPELSHFLNAYIDQQAKVSAEGEDTDVGAALRALMALNAAGKMDEREALLRVTCVTLKCYVGFKNRWKDSPARLDVRGDGEAVVSGNVTKFPGGNDISLALSDQKLQEMGLL